MTARLMLRPFCDADRAPYAALNADPEVREFYPRLLTRAEADAQIERFRADASRDGFGVWAVEAVGVAPFIGITGLKRVPADLPCAPAIEILWRLARPWWGQGYASEAARAALDDGARRCGIAEVVAFAVAANRRSSAVMRRIGMIHDPAGDFDHPHLAAGSPLRRHVLYRWHAERGGTDAIR